mmetsp:Transcript_35860/g.76477  ORF Transcript_35860/g.76477 Transcript_35860/m.76477 type:complete len:200 (+) Transcript_35860:1099-1698(+)
MRVTTKSMVCASSVPAIFATLEVKARTPGPPPGTMVTLVIAIGPTTGESPSSKASAAMIATMKSDSPLRLSTMTDFRLSPSRRRTSPPPSSWPRLACNRCCTDATSAREDGNTKSAPSQASSPSEAKIMYLIRNSIMTSPDRTSVRFLKSRFLLMDWEQTKNCTSQDLGMNSVSPSKEILEPNRRVCLPGFNAMLPLLA